MNYEAAACRGMDPAIFITERGQSTSPAKEVCSGCAVREECLVHAVVTREKQGVWGGLSERQRKKVRVGVARLAECGVCGGEFSASAASQRYCGPECSSTATRRARRDHMRRVRGTVLAS